MDHTLLNPVYDRFVKDPLCKSLVSFSRDMRDCLIGVLNDLAGKGYVPQSRVEWNTLWLDIAVCYFRLPEDCPNKQKSLYTQMLSLPYIYSGTAPIICPAPVRS